MSDTLTGRELDAKIHTTLFGKPCEWIASEPHEQTPDADSPTGFVYNFGGAVFGSDRDWHVDEWFDFEANLPVPEYSASWAGAGEVLSEMRRRGYLVMIEDWQERGWCVLFTFPNGHDTGQILGDTIGEAVCRAALLALEATR